MRLYIYSIYIFELYNIKLVKINQNTHKIGNNELKRACIQNYKNK